MSNELSTRDASILRHMLKYCMETDEALAYFGDDEALFMRSAVFRNAISMPIQQIGELAKHLSDAFIDTYPQMPWRQIKGMRDWFAHQYIKMDNAVIWNVAKVDMPPLKAFLREQLEEVNREGALRAFSALRAEARANGVCDLTLDEINAEIQKAREKMEGDA